MAGGERFMNESRWKGYIKDYNGSTMMQCAVHPDVTHSTFYGDIRFQQKQLMAMIANTARVAVYPGLPFTLNKKSFNFDEIPGLREAGWTEEIEKKGR